VMSVHSMRRYVFSVLLVAVVAASILSLGQVEASTITEWTLPTDPSGPLEGSTEASVCLHHLGVSPIPPCAFSGERHHIGRASRPCPALHERDETDADTSASSHGSAALAACKGVELVLYLPPEAPISRPTSEASPQGPEAMLRGRCLP